MTTTNKQDKFILIVTMRLAGYLMQRGFPIMDMRPDELGSKRKVFIFNNSPQIQEAIQKYTYNRK